MHTIVRHSLSFLVASHAVAMGLAALGCGTDDVGDTPPPTRITAAASGIPLVQGASSGALGVAAGKDAGNACAEPGTSIQPSRELVSHTIALPPIFDGSDTIVRLPQVLRIDATGCHRVAAVDAAEAPQFRTGFGGPVPGYEDKGWGQWAGLMLRLVETEDELWLFHNGSRNFWRINPVAGTATVDTSINRFVAGATSDGAGGAWLTTLVETWMGSITVSAELLHLDTRGVIDQTIALPFTEHVTGFGSGAEGSEIAVFLSQDARVGPDGRVWLVHSGERMLHAIDPVTEMIESHPLDVFYPTGIAWHGDTLVLVAGLHGVDDAAGGPPTILQYPALYQVDPASGALTSLLNLPEPQGGWTAWSGFGGQGDPAVSGWIPMDIWFNMVSAGGQLVVTDPATGRILIAD